MSNDKIDQDKVKAIIHSIGLKYGLQDSIITKIVNSPYKFAREKITELDFHSIETEEEFNKLKTNFIWPYIGKLYTNFDRLLRLRKQKEILTNYNKETKWKNK